MSVLASLVNLRGRDTVREWGEQLKGEHRATNPLELPDFMKPKVMALKMPSTLPKAAAASPVRVGAVPSQAEAAERRPSPVPALNDAMAFCATCGKPLTPKVAAFCLDKAAWFGGKLYCYNHQADAKKK